MCGIVGYIFANLCGSISTNFKSEWHLLLPLGLLILTPNLVEFIVANWSLYTFAVTS